jgi:hypothetical protein
MGLFDNCCELVSTASALWNRKRCIVLQSRSSIIACTFADEEVTCPKPICLESWGSALGLRLLEVRDPGSRINGAPRGESVHPRSSSGKDICAPSMDRVGLEGSRRSSSSDIPRPTPADKEPPPLPESNPRRIGLERVLQSGGPRARSLAMDPEPKVLSAGELARLIIDMALGEAPPANAAQQGVDGPSTAMRTCAT